MSERAQVAGLLVVAAIVTASVRHIVFGDWVRGLALFLLATIVVVAIDKEVD